MVPIDSIKQIGIPVNDISRAIKFYQEQLQLPLLFQTDSMAFFNCNGIRLLLSLPEKEAYAGASSVLYFHTYDIESTYAVMINNGVHFLNKPHVVAKMGNTETWMTFFKDTEENTHALISDVELES
mgnify:FL=1